jgi:hypothetical protein
MENKFGKTSSSTMSRLKQYSNPPEEEKNQAEQQRQADQQKKVGLMRQVEQQKKVGLPRQTGQQKQAEQTIKSDQKRPMEKMPEASKFIMTYPVSMEGGLTVTPERLKEAVIWSEIIGKPVSKRRRHKF